MLQLNAMDGGGATAGATVATGQQVRRTKLKVVSQTITPANRLSVSDTSSGKAASVTAATGSTPSSSRFSQDEKDLLFSLFAKHHHIIDIKCRKKQRAKYSVRESWLQILHEFNGSAVTMTPRTIKQLQKFWLNSRLRKQYPYHQSAPSGSQSPTTDPDMSLELQRLNDSMIKAEPAASIYNNSNSPLDGTTAADGHHQQSLQHDEEEEDDDVVMTAGNGIGGEGDGDVEGDADDGDGDGDGDDEHHQQPNAFAQMDIDSNAEISDGANVDHQATYETGPFIRDKHSPDVSDLLHFKPAAARTEGNIVTSQIATTTTGTAHISLAHYQSQQQQAHQQQQHLHQPQQHASIQLATVQQQQQQYITQPQQTQLIAVSNETHNHHQQQPQQHSLKLQYTHGGGAQFAAGTYAFNAMPLSLGSLPHTIVASGDNIVTSVANDQMTAPSNGAGTLTAGAVATVGSSANVTLEHSASTQEKIAQFQIREVAERAREAEHNAREAEARKKTAQYTCECKRLEVIRLQEEMQFLREHYTLRLDEIRLRVRKLRSEIPNVRTVNTRRDYDAYEDDGEADGKPIF